MAEPVQAQIPRFLSKSYMNCFPPHAGAQSFTSKHSPFELRLFSEVHLLYTVLTHYGVSVYFANVGNWNPDLQTHSPVYLK